ncbi:MAG: N-acetyl-gamma-glutamyl-phosphate reductase [Ktedonobacteraceae bacterium]|nr:N-acetyl-gamma-glutamyl-phosphate reductase [Ktedonobacteraceae bacterium]
MIKVSIINGTSYTALELLRLLALHPEFVVTSVTGRSAVGQRLGDVFPQLLALPASGVRTVDPALVITEEPGECELAFVCLPHAAAAEAVVKLLERGTKVVDLSADFRLRDAGVYEQWYKHVHPAPRLLESAVYGLCERYRAAIGQATLVANPGCHVTTSLLALIPALEAGLIEPGIIVDSKTGVSGAGRSLKLDSLYSEVNEDVAAYALAGHRHMPEIAQELEAAAADGGHPLRARLTFIPHLMPMTRGILATCYADLKPEFASLTGDELRARYEHYYEGEPFVHVIDRPPHTKWTYGSNHCFVYPLVDARTQRLVVVACLDNLVKGASGQAIQNANLMFGLPETSGLQQPGVTP